jgi:hypothetical protein
MRPRITMEEESICQILSRVPKLPLVWVSYDFALFNAYDEEFEHKPLTTKGWQVSHANVLSAFSAMCGIDTK